MAMIKKYVCMQFFPQNVAISSCKNLIFKKPENPRTRRFQTRTRKLTLAPNPNPKIPEKYLESKTR